MALRVEVLMEYSAGETIQARLVRDALAGCATIESPLYPLRSTSGRDGSVPPSR